MGRWTPEVNQTSVHLRSALYEHTQAQIALDALNEIPVP